MKRPPSNPEFARFTEAMRRIMTVPKTDIQAAMAEEKRQKATTSARRVSGRRASRALATSPKSAN